MLNYFLEAPRPIKRGISIIYDIAAIGLSLYIAYSLRLGTSYDFSLEADLYTYFMTALVSITTFIRLGLYRAVLRYMTYQAIYTVGLGVAISGIALIANSFFFEAQLPRSVPVIYIFCALILVGLPRLIFRSLMQAYKINTKEKEKVIIYGAGAAGSQLAVTLQHSSTYQPIAFIDDNKKLQKSSIRDLNIYGFNKLDKLIERFDATKVLLALGNTPRAQRHRVVRKMEHLPIQILTVPNMTDILSGNAQVNDLKDIEIEDLLGRDPSTPDLNLMRANIEGKTVLVTGAGGSIGSELCQQIIQLKVSTLVLLEVNEYNLYQIQEGLTHLAEKLEFKPQIKCILGSADDFYLLKKALTSNSVDTIYHAAAYKHVPIIESNVVAGLKNNVLSTWYTATAAIEAKVSTFVLISSDKAVRPTNIMGATKRIAELVLQGLDLQQHNTRFSMVRFGNVLGSSGSVVPKFKEQILGGGPITVTHPEINRYFMATSEAAQLVIQAGAMASGGDVYVLDMGEPVGIASLAREMILLSGLQVKDKQNPSGDIEIIYTGLRPGEKLFEELLVDKNCQHTNHPLISRAKEVSSLNWSEIQKLISNIESLDYESTPEDIHRILNTSHIFYKPNQESARADNIHPISEAVQVANTLS